MMLIWYLKLRIVWHRAKTYFLIFKRKIINNIHIHIMSTLAKLSSNYGTYILALLVKINVEWTQYNED